MTRLSDPRLRDYLGHMLQAIERIADYTQGMDREGFGASPVGRSGQRGPQPPSAHRTVRTGPYTAPHARRIH